MAEGLEPSCLQLIKLVLIHMSLTTTETENARSGRLDLNQCWWAPTIRNAGLPLTEVLYPAELKPLQTL